MVFSEKKKWWTTIVVHRFLGIFMPRKRGMKIHIH